MSESVQYLSDQWLKEADALLGGLKPITGSIAVAVVVLDGPQGDRRYRMVLGPDRVGIDPDTDAGDVRMTMNWDVAVSIAKGSASAQRTFLDGHIQLGGDAALILGHQRELARIDDRLAPLRAKTVYAGS